MAAAASRLLQLSGTLGAAAAALPELKLREVAQGIALDLATLARSLEVSSEAVTQKRQEKRLPTATVKAYPKDAVTALCCNGADVISGSDGGCLKCWSIDTGKCLAEAQGHRDSILKLEWHSADSEGRLFSISKDRSLKIWSGQLQCQQAIEGLPRGVSSLAVLGSTFAVGARDHLIHLWSLETLQPLRKFQGHSDAVLAVESCQPLELLVSGGNDRSVRLWDRTEAACRAVLLGHGGPVTCVAVCAQRRMVASGSKDKTVKLWNIDQESCVATLEGHKSYVRALTFLTDGHLASGSSDRSCRLWDVELQSCEVEFEDHSDSVLVLTSVTTMTGQRLVSGSDDTTLKIWSTERASGK